MRGLVRALPAVVVTLGLSCALEREDSPGEKALALAARTADPYAAAQVKVVRINDDEYDTLFAEQSPLDPATVTRLIRALASAHPRVIGIDLESVSPAYAQLPDAIDGVPLVWQRQTRCIRRGDEVATCSAAERELQPAAGGDPAPFRSGLAMLPEEDDGSTRRYSRRVDSRFGPYPAFSTVVLRRAGILVGDEPPDRSRLIRYRPIAPADSDFTANSALLAAKGGGFGPRNALRGRIVLLGGTFTKGGDRHLTPLGAMPGVAVQAQVVETELAGGGPRPPGWLAFFVVQCVAGGLIFLVLRIRSLWRAVILGVVVCVAAALTASLVLFNTASLWFYFVPAVCVWVVQPLYDKMKDYRDKLLRMGLTPAQADSRPPPAAPPSPAPAAD